MLVMLVLGRRWRRKFRKLLLPGRRRRRTFRTLLMPVPGRRWGRTFQELSVTVLGRQLECLASRRPQTTSRRLLCGFYSTRLRTPHLPRTPRPAQVGLIKCCVPPSSRRLCVQFR